MLIFLSNNEWARIFLPTLGVRSEHLNTPDASVSIEDMCEI